MNLYEIDARLKQLLDKETGEVSEDFSIEEFELLEMTKAEKQKNLAFVIKNEESDLKAIKEKILILEERADKKENSIKRMKDWLALSLDEGEKVKTPFFTISKRKSESVAIKDENLIPKEYFKTKTTTEISKSMIKDDLKAGKDVPGASIQVNYSAQIRE